MALGGISVTWDTANPSSASTFGSASIAEVKSFKTTLSEVLDSEHVFAAGGGANTGVHRKGSAVAFYGASSAISSTDTDGRLMIDSTKTRLWHVGSTTTRVLGSRYAVESCSTLTMRGTGVTSKVTQVWGIESGVYLFEQASSSTVVTLQHSYVTAIAVIQSRAGWSASTIGGIPQAVITATNQMTISNCSLTAGKIENSKYTYLCMYQVMGIRAL